MMPEFDRERRRLLATMVGLTAAACGRSRSETRRPNILLALADDWSWTSASTRDDLSLAIPTFRRMAAEGLSFANAFVAAPSCSASRAAMLTGQWPWRLEDGANLAGTLDARFPVYPDLLEKAGYHVGFTGKGWARGRSRPAIGPGTLPGRFTRTSTRSLRPGAAARRSVSGSAATTRTGSTRPAGERAPACRTGL